MECEERSFSRSVRCARWVVVFAQLDNFDLVPIQWLPDKKRLIYCKRSHQEKRQNSVSAGAAL